MALSWVLRDNKITSALIGASSAKQIIENTKGGENLNFSSEEEALIKDALSKISLPESLWASE